MPFHTGRRRFLKTSAALVGLGNLDVLSQYALAQADDTEITPEHVRLSPDIEPLVRLILETPKEESARMMVEQMSNGVTYRQFLAALFMASLRQSPHAVYRILSVHQLGLDVELSDRLIPLCWALHSTASLPDPSEKYPGIRLNRMPSAELAARELNEAMTRFDIERAGASLLALCRSEGAKPAFNRLWSFVPRDPSNVGHRAIAFVNAWRTLEVVGWRHAESLIQFVVHELCQGRTVFPLFHTNRERADTAPQALPKEWAGTRPDAGATRELLSLLHAGQSHRACEWTYEALRSGKVQAQAVWDAVFLGAGELMLRFNRLFQLSARPLHTSTSMNALRYAFDACDTEPQRLLILLQAVDWTAGFTITERNRGLTNDMKITELAMPEVPDSAEDAVQAIVDAQPARDPNDRRAVLYVGERSALHRTSEMAFAYGHKHDHGLLIQTLRRLMCLKATKNVHDVKFITAVFENYQWASPQWRSHVLAASMQWMHGTATADSIPIQRAREALKGLG